MTTETLVDTGLSRAENVRRLAKQIYEARCHQADCKKAMLDATAAFSQIRAKAYLAAADDGCGHYQAQNQATADPKVIQAKQELTEAQIAHYRAWTKTAYVAQLHSSLVLRPNPEDDPCESNYDLEWFTGDHIE